MKTARAHEISFSGNAKLHRALGNIRPGDAISAEILERREGGKAVLRIVGEKITAHFLSGIPRGKYQKLVLVSREKNQYVFKTAPEKQAALRMREFDRFIIADDLKIKQHLPNIRNLLLEGHTLYDTNRIIAGITGQSSSGAIAGFLNALLRRGITRKQADAFAAVIMKLKGGVSPLIASIIAMMSNKEGVLDDAASAVSESSARGIADYAAELLESVEWDAEMKLNYGELLKGVLQRQGDNNEQEIPFFDDEKYMTARMHVQAHWVACELSLSELGRLEIYGREENGMIVLSIVCARDKSVEILSRDLYHLQKKLQLVDKNGVMVTVWRESDARETVLSGMDDLLRESHVDIHA